ncbi:hypothetical protein AB4099_31575 [Bosea sp. 2KB_26]|uniref:hypothetical protein n=1 Tax=Bosea sp. 2KB_26 TaxID=3237475 RepID=UPI000DE54E91
MAAFAVPKRGGQEDWLVLKLNEHDIRGESSRDYVRRIPLWRQALWLLICVAMIIISVIGLAFVFVTARQMFERLPFWLNVLIIASYLVPLAVAAIVKELRDRW